MRLRGECIVQAQRGWPTTSGSWARFSALLLLVSGIAQADPAELIRDVQSQRLQAELRRGVPEQGLAISVVLREPRRNARVMPPGSRRRARVAARQGRVLGALPGSALSLRHRHREISGFTAWANARAIAILASHPEVVSIDLDRDLVATLSQGVPLIGADIAHAMGVTGAGVTVAVVDSGFDSDHPDLANALVAEVCFCDDDPESASGCCPDGTQEQIGPGSAEDDNGHGTEISGVITSNTVNNTGVAPDAGIVAIKVLDSTGHGVGSDLEAGLDWILSDGIGLGVRVVNISIGDTLEHDDAGVLPCTGSNTSAAISALHAAGVVVFVSSGNDVYSGGISHPACTPDAISVASVYDANFSGINFGVCQDVPAPVDSIPCLANTGSLLDLLAPGAVTTTSQMGGGQGGEVGTSIASAYAAGQAALLIEADGALTPDAIKNLMSTNGPMVLDLDNSLMFPRTDIEEALIALPEPNTAFGLITGAALIAAVKRARQVRQISRTVE